MSKNKMSKDEATYRIGMALLSCVDYLGFALFLFACYKFWGYLPK